MFRGLDGDYDDDAERIKLEFQSPGQRSGRRDQRQRRRRLGRLSGDDSDDAMILSRRHVLRSLVTAPAIAASFRAAARAQPSDTGYGAGTLPSGIRSRVIPGVNGISMHVLEAGFDPAGRPGLLLVHGFPARL